MFLRFPPQAAIFWCGPSLSCQYWPALEAPITTQQAQAVTSEGIRGEIDISSEDSQQSTRPFFQPPEMAKDYRIKSFPKIEASVERFSDVTATLFLTHNIALVDVQHSLRPLLSISQLDDSWKESLDHY